MGLRAKLSGPGMFRKSTGLPFNSGRFGHLWTCQGNHSLVVSTIFEGVETTKQFWLRQPVFRHWVSQPGRHAEI